MREASFNGVDLSHSSYWAVLKQARFEDCNLHACVFTNANLASSTFENINLSDATFHNINMSGVSLRNLNLSNVQIADANMTGMTINGVLVADLFAAYENAAKSEG